MEANCRETPLSYLHWWIISTPRPATMARFFHRHNERRGSLTGNKADWIGQTCQNGRQLSPWRLPNLPKWQTLARSGRPGTTAPTVNLPKWQARWPPKKSAKIKEKTPRC